MRMKSWAGDLALAVPLPSLECPAAGRDHQFQRGLRISLNSSPASGLLLILSPGMHSALRGPCRPSNRVVIAAAGLNPVQPVSNAPTVSIPLPTLEHPSRREVPAGEGPLTVLKPPGWSVGQEQVNRNQAPACGRTAGTSPPLVDPAHNDAELSSNAKRSRSSGDAGTLAQSEPPLLAGGVRVVTRV